MTVRMKKSNTSWKIHCNSQHNLHGFEVRKPTRFLLTYQFNREKCTAIFAAILLKIHFLEGDNVENVNQYDYDGRLYRGYRQTS